MGPVFQALADTVSQHCNFFSVRLGADLSLIGAQVIFRGLVAKLTHTMILVPVTTCTVAGMAGALSTCFALLDAVYYWLE